MEPGRRSSPHAVATAAAAVASRRDGGNITAVRPRARIRTGLRVVPFAGAPSRPMTQEPTSRAAPVPRLLELERRHAGLAFRDIRARIVAGRDDGWRLFVERYSRTLYTVALSLAAPPEREEVAQQAYLSILERLARDDCRLLREFREDARFETYLFTAARNAVAQLRRERASRRSHETPHEASETPHHAVAPAEAGPDLIESIGLAPDKVADLLAESLSTLEPRERLVLRLRFREGLPYRRLARLFGWKDTNAAAYEVCRILRKLKLLERCRQRLRWGEPERELLLRGLKAWLGPAAEQPHRDGADAG